MTLNRVLLLTCATAVLAIAPAAKADPVTDAGSVYNLTYVALGTDSYQFTLTVDASHYAPGDATDELNAVALNILKSSGSYSGYSVVSEPAGYQTTLQGGALGAGGCSDNSSNYLCLAFATSPGGVAVDSPGDVYTFVFDIATSAGGFKTSGDGVKAVYDTIGKPDNAANTDVYTESIDPVPTPEPSSLALLGTGILGAAGALRRRLKA